ncbi:MAG: glycosyltransferase family 2 protein [Dongiaceae bacterium]
MPAPGHDLPPPGGGSGDDPSGATPLVSLLVPVCDRVELTRDCLDSVFACADPAIPTEILVIDDCSIDDTPAYLASLGERITVVRNATRQGFARNMNDAAAVARGAYLCLLNNDTRVTPGWLARLVAAARRDPRIGVVGNRQLTPGTGTINHAGMVFDDDGQPVHLHAGRPGDFPPALLGREFQIVTAACWLVPRRLFQALGGFDPAFRNGYEDVDFCLRVRERGGIVYYAGDSVIYHIGLQSPGRRDHEQANAAHFRQKWQGRVTPDLHTYLERDGLLPQSRPQPAAATSRTLDLARRVLRTPPAAACWRLILARPWLRPLVEAVRRLLLALP